MKNSPKKRYSKICNACDSVLLGCNSRFEIVAINFLHVIRGSTTTLQRYAYLFNNELWVSRIIRYHYLFMKNIMSILYNFMRSIFYRTQRFNDTPHNVDFLFISHFTGVQKGSIYYQDSYFGDMVNQLCQNGKSSVVAYINHTKNKDVIFQKKSGVLSILLSNITSFSNLIKIYQGVFTTHKSLRKGNNSLRSKVVKQARISVLSTSTVRNLIIADQVGSIIERYSPNCIITTYEGHAWERLMFAVARSINPDIKCISYQHVPLFKFQHAIRRNLGRQYNPDVILTSGRVSATQLKSIDELHKVQISVIGSGRNIISESNSLSHPRGFDVVSCLVVPEGTIDECNVLFEFSLRCAKNNRDINFIFRLPPMININLLIKRNKKFRNLPDNITISEVSLLKDILRSNVILYRGSSVVIQGVVFGLKPIYLRVNNELTMDPLYEITDGREIVSSIEEFEHSLSKNIDTNIKEKLVSYCKDMYTPLDIGVLENVLKN